MNFDDENWKIEFFENYFDEGLPFDKVREYLNQKMEFFDNHLLYQYTKVRHIEDLINDNLMYLRKLDELNDPLEGELICDYKNTLNVTLDEDKFSNYSDEEKEQIKYQIKQQEIANMNNMWHKVKKHMSIACFSEKYDIGPLWAHYSDNHKGVCVGYDFKLNNAIGSACFPVCYVGDADNKYVCKKLYTDLKSENRLLSQLFLKKGLDWRYEKEWRILIPDNLKSSGIDMKWKNRKRYLKFFEPNEIYLGYDISREDEEYLKGVCHDYDIKLYKMVRDDSGYNLKPKKINIYSL